MLTYYTAEDYEAYARSYIDFQAINNYLYVNFGEEDGYTCETRPFAEIPNYNKEGAIITGEELFTHLTRRQYLDQVAEKLKGFRNQYGALYRLGVDNWTEGKTERQLLNGFKKLIGYSFYGCLFAMAIYIKKLDPIKDHNVDPDNPIPKITPEYLEVYYRAHPERLNVVKTFINEHMENGLDLIIIDIHKEALEGLGVKGLEKIYQDYRDGLTPISEALKLSEYHIAELKLPKQAAIALPNQDTAKLRNWLQPIDKVTRNIHEIKSPDEQLEIDVTGNKESDEVLTLLSATFDSDLLSEKPLDSYDVVLNIAAANLWLSGARFVTTEQIVRAATGAERPGKTQIEEAEKRLERQRHIDITLDYSRELRGRDAVLDGEKVTGFIKKRYLFHAGEDTLTTANGRKVTGWKLYDERPILLEHAQAVNNQITSYQARYLETSEVGSNTETNVVIKHYLLERIHILRNNFKHRAETRYKRITYDKMLERAGINPDNRKGKKRAVDFALGCLELWKQQGLIKGYEEVVDGRSHRKHAVDIEL